MDMKLSEVIEHLGNRGAIRRQIWNPKAMLVFGMDNIGWFYFNVPLPADEVPKFYKTRWIPDLAQILADDWEIVDLNWEHDREKFDGLKVGYNGEVNG